jgi:hypothetical protein
MKQLSSTQETPAHSRVHLKAGVEKGGTAGQKMIAIANAMAMAVPKPPADPLEARGCPGIDALGQNVSPEAEIIPATNRPLNHFEI